MQMTAIPTVATPSTRLPERNDNIPRGVSWVARGLPSLLLHSQEPPPTFQSMCTVQLQDGDRQERSEGVSELRTAVQDCGTEGKLFLAESVCRWINTRPEEIAKSFDRPRRLTCTNNSGRRSHRGTVKNQTRVNTTSKRFRDMRGKTRTHEDGLGDTQRDPGHHQPHVIMNRSRQSRDHSPCGTSQTDVQGRAGDLADDHV